MEKIRKVGTVSRGIRCPIFREGDDLARITAEVDGINRVLYDLTPKPTGTIEWE